MVVVATKKGHLGSVRVCCKRLGMSM